MGFADAYLLKAGLREKLIETEPHSDLKIIVTIPVYNESGLERCLDSLFQCRVSAGVYAEVIILINAPSDAPEAILARNRATCNAVWNWTGEHPHPSIDFYVLLDHSFVRKEAGVGMARKILMDEAVRRFNSVGASGGRSDGRSKGRSDGIIASMDADAVVEENYLEAIVENFESRNSDGCSIYFEHPLDDETTASYFSGESFSPEVYDAIAQYELHLRYYLQSVRATGFPHAFHTVGSSFAVLAEVYCKEGGMNRRQGGEDFYFIQKVAQRGNYSECNATRVIPSPRPSDRVPFGTGPVVSRLSSPSSSSSSSPSSSPSDQGAQQLYTYDPRPFHMLRDLFIGLETMYAGVETMHTEVVSMYSEAAPDHFMKSQPEVLLEFLESQQFGEALVEIRKNSASFPAFRKRFWRWFNMFRIMKFLHHAREQGYPDVPVGEASLGLLKQIKPEGVMIPSDDINLKKLLLIFRKIDRSEMH